MLSAFLNSVMSLFTWLFTGKRTKTIPEQEDVVLLYQVGRGPHAPSSSPFPLKLETFLRMHKIPYMNDHTSKFSSKGKTPWIRYNGVSVADSDFSIRYVKEKRKIPTDDLDPSQMAIARAFQKMTEENLYWTMCHFSFVDDVDNVGEALPQYKGFKLWMLVAILSRVLRLEMWGHGIGRHSSQDIARIAKDDIKALSIFLGTKQFLFGNEPKEIDCCIFAMVAQIVYHMPGSYHIKHIEENCPNLIRYCERMIERFWPDWNDRLYNAENLHDDMGHIYHQQN